MTSNAEQQANTPAAATAQPPKATKRGHVPPDKRRIAPGKQNRERRPAGPTAAQKPKGRQTGQTRRRCPRGQHGSQSPKPAEAAGRRFVERANESYRLVGTFCPWIPERSCRQEDEAQARVREERGRGAPLLRRKVNRTRPSQQAAAEAMPGGFSLSVSRRNHGHPLRPRQRGSPTSAA